MGLEALTHNVVQPVVSIRQLIVLRNICSLACGGAFDLRDQSIDFTLEGCNPSLALVIVKFRGGSCEIQVATIDVAGITGSGRRNLGNYQDCCSVIQHLKFLL